MIDGVLWNGWIYYFWMFEFWCFWVIIREVLFVGNDWFFYCIRDYL